MDNEQTVGSAITPAAGAAAPSGALPPGIELWKKAWGIFRAKMGVFIGIGAVGAVASSALAYAADAKRWGLFSLLNIVVLAVQLLVYAAYIYAAQKEGNVAVGDAFRFALGKFWRLVWLGIVSTAVLMGLFCLLFVPGIIAMGWFAFAAYVLVLEDQGGMNAMFYSREYVRGYWWPVIGYVLVPSLILGVIVAIVDGILKSVGLASIQYVVSLATGLFIGPPLAVYSYLVYAAFKKHKGTVAPDVSSGRKAKYAVAAVIGLLLPGLMLIVTAFGAMSSSRRAASESPSALQNANSSADYDKLIDQLNKMKDSQAQK